MMSGLLYASYMWDETEKQTNMKHTLCDIFFTFQMFPGLMVYNFGEVFKARLEPL